MRDDHFKHLALSFMICAVLLTPARHFPLFLYVAPILTLLAGIFKEIYDRHISGFSLSDIAFDIAGIALAMLLYVR